MCVKKMEKEAQTESVDVEVRSGILSDKINGHAVQDSLVTAKTRDKNEESALGPAGIEDKIKELGGVLENEPDPITEQHPKTENLVSYDKDEDVESISTYSGGKQIQSNLSIPPSEISVQEEFASFRSSKEIQSPEDDLINGDELEVTELDVKKVLQKQTTHDLYCPNCNSCITRRVILRKRKRRIRTTDEELKRNEIENAADPSDQIGVGLGDTQLPTSDDHERDRDPDVFRCLSCFNFFIPNGNGFKLFHIYRDKNVKQDAGDENVTSTKRNWFTSMFATHKQETAVGQGSNLETDARESDIRAPLLSKLGDQSGKPSSEQKEQKLVHTSGVVGTSQNNETVESRDEILPFPKQEPAIIGKVIIGLGDNSNEATEKIDATTEEFQTYAREQLKESKSSKDLRVDHKDRTPKRSQVTNEESSEDAFLFSQGGLKFLISSDKGNVTPEGSPRSISELEVPDTDEKQRISVAFPHKQQQIGSHIPTESCVDNKNATLSIHNTAKDTIIKIDGGAPELCQTQIGTPTVPIESATALLSGTPLVIARTESRNEFEIEVVKSIVYGGLAESITSLSVVSSAAGGTASTLNILAIGIANVIGGLFIICHNLWELQYNRTGQVANQISDQVQEQRDRYKELLGRRQNFIVHAVLALTSYFIFGLLPPVVYGFSFRKSDDKELKLLVVAAASLVCIVVLAVGRAHVQTPPKPYLKSVLTFVMLGFMVSGVSYAGGVLIERLLEKLHLFHTSSVSNIASV